ncbi:MAG: alpha-galactosidase [Lachnospiraceae bacterium]|nr:alpha-galactosidase [Lachnospiraceae bacterium]
MEKKILNQYELGDMLVQYLTNENGQVGLQLLPAKFDGKEQEKNEQLDSLVQLKVTGDVYNEAYAMGNSMRNGETVRRLKFVEQKVEEEETKKTIATVLKDDRGYQVTHYLVWKENTPYVRMFCEFENLSSEVAELEMFESFSLGNLSPYMAGDGHETLNIYRMRSVWSQEGRMEVLLAEDLQLEPAWDPHAVRCEKFGQAGSMPVNKFFPFVAVEDTKNQVFWGAQIAHPASWQMELYRKDDGLCISGGLADRDFGQWLKRVNPKEGFKTPEAIVSVANTNSIDIFTGRLTEAAREGMEKAPEIERDLPIVFNEYCTTWGNPSHENIASIVEKIKDKDFTYFVIDCGWYKEEGVPWDIGMGDYEVSKVLFPDGLQKTVDVIKEAGMIPGLWFEIENVGSAARAYQMEEHLLHRDGKVLTSYFRRFWDMRDPWVEEYLTKKVIGTLKEYGFGYMKIDYNETIGMGCDGAESTGEALRQCLNKTQEFIEKVKREVPGIVLENCASGGHRLEPSLMAQMSMASFSDAHECPEIPIIAANLHRLIHPAQSQIWAVIRETDSLKRIAYSVINTFLGRMCISGDVTNLTQEQWAIMDGGMAFYKKIAPIILKGQSYRYGTKIKSARNPKGWQGLVRMGENNEAVAIIHTFAGDLPKRIEFKLPRECSYEIEEVFSDTEEKVNVEDGQLCYEVSENWKAVAVKIRFDD